jgi:predicted permease
MWTDLRYAWRTLRRSPIFALSAIIALALGIGANTAVFSVVYAVLLAPLPFAEPERLVRLSEVDPSGTDTRLVSIGTFIDWRARSRTLETIAVYTIPGSGQTLWTLGDRLEVVKSSAASADLFGVLRGVPVLGRTFVPDDPRGAASTDTRKFVISYDFWQRAYGGAPGVIGRSVTVEGRFASEIIGVMPRGFVFPQDVDAWANLPFGSSVPPPRRRAQSFNTIARLRPGVTLEAAQAELVDISAQLAKEQPASNAGWSARLVLQSGSDTMSVKPALLALLGAVGGVLLIACASVANLLLARASGRRHELAVRVALGATAFRLIRQALSEALLLAVLGAAAGLGLGTLLTRVLVRLAPSDVPRLDDVGLNWIVLIFGITVAALTATAIGVMPALGAARLDRSSDGANARSRGATARGRGVRRMLIAAEVAVVVLLLIGAALLGRTFVKLRGVDLGFEPARVIEVSTRWPIGALFPSTPGVRPWPRVQRAVDGLIATVEGVPGVEAVGLVSDVPLTGAPFGGRIWRADAPGASGLTPPTDTGDRWKADLLVVSNGYFNAIEAPILRGRNFADGDRLSDEQLTNASARRAAVVIVNRAFASRYFGTEDPVGRTLIVADDQEFGWSRTIIGVVADVRARAVSESAGPAIFIPHAQHPDVFAPSLLVRSALPPAAIAIPIRERIHDYDASILVQRVRPMEAVVSGALARPRFNLVLLSAFALVALLLAALGIYGVVSFLVAQRTREIGIRMALGARAADVRRLVLGESMTPVACGAIAGLVAAVAATRTLRSMLFGVSPLDAVSFIAAPALLVLVALTACYLPARRATRVDPLVALRDE